MDMIKELAFFKMQMFFNVDAKVACAKRWKLFHSSRKFDRSSGHKFIISIKGCEHNSFKLSYLHILTTNSCFSSWHFSMDQGHIIVDLTFFKVDTDMVTYYRVKFLNSIITLYILIYFKSITSYFENVVFIKITRSKPHIIC